MLTLGRLTDAQALELLAARLGRDRLAAEPRAAAEVAALCAGLPLALGGVAARAVVSPSRTLAALAAELRAAASWLGALSLLDELPAGGRYEEKQ